MTSPTQPHVTAPLRADVEPQPPPASLDAHAPEPVYEARLRITGMTEYGFPLEDALAGAAPIPPEGARLDVAFDGTISGASLAGTAAGVDHVYLRADGRMELHIHARLTTADGANVPLFADGVGTLGPDRVVELRESARLHSSAARYRWVNALALRRTGQADLARGEIHVQAFLA